MSRERNETVRLDTVILAAQVLPVLIVGTLYAVGLVVADKSWHALKERARERL